MHKQSIDQLNDVYNKNTNLKPGVSVLDDISIVNLHKNDSGEMAAVSDQPTCTKEKCSINSDNLIDEPHVISVVKLNANSSQHCPSLG